MADPTKAEPRYDTGETAQEATDRMAGDGRKASMPTGNPPHPSAAANPGPTAKAPGESIHPSAQGIYGAPLGSTILK
jgi:hypothetical protein